MLAPAVQYAERGFPITSTCTACLSIPETRSQFELFPPGGDDVSTAAAARRGWASGFVQPALGATLRRLDRGRRHGRVAAALPASRPRAPASTGATWRRRSARSPSAWVGSCGPPTWRATARGIEPPVRTTFPGPRDPRARGRGRRGPVLMQALGHPRDPSTCARMGHNSARYIHVVAGGAQARVRRPGAATTATSRCAAAELLSPAYARERAALIRMDRAAPEAPAPGDPRSWVAGRGASRGPRTAPQRRGRTARPTSPRSIATAT